MIEETMTREDKMVHWVVLCSECTIENALRDLMTVIESDLEAYKNTNSPKAKKDYQVVLDDAEQKIEIYTSTNRSDGKEQCSTFVTIRQSGDRTVSVSSHGQKGNLFDIKQSWNLNRYECELLIHGVPMTLQEVSQRCLIRLLFGIEPYQD